MHQQVWGRFIRLPQGHLLDYADETGAAPIPTLAECARCMPKPLGWWTPIENGAFFTGLYAYALLSSPNPDPQELKNRLLRTLNGLKSCGWAVPTEREGMITNVWGDNHDWRGVVKLLYCARLLYELTGEKSALEEYIFLRNSTQKDCFSREKRALRTVFHTIWCSSAASCSRGSSPARTSACANCAALTPTPRRTMR